MASWLNILKTNPLFAPDFPDDLRLVSLKSVANQLPPPASGVLPRRVSLTRWEVSETEGVPPLSTNWTTCIEISPGSLSPTKGRRRNFHMAAETDLRLSTRASKSRYSPRRVPFAFCLGGVWGGFPSPASQPYELNRIRDKGKTLRYKKSCSNEEG